MRARRALAGRGYRQVRLTCRGVAWQRRNVRCRWTARHGSSTCAGALIGVRQARGGWRIGISQVRCGTAAVVPPVAPVAPVYGFNTYTTQQTVAMQRSVGATVTRLFIDWSTVEPGAGTWDWQQSDQEYHAILAGGLRPLLVAFAAPCWAAPSAGCNPLLIEPPDPAHDPDWAAYIRQLAIRYPQAIGIEVWSEPNLATNFWPKPNPIRYAQLLKEAYTTIKSVDSAMPVISGGLLLGDGTGTGPGGETSASFLTSLYAAGADRYMDALGIHIYPSDPPAGRSRELWDPAAMTRWLHQISDVRGAAGLAPKPLWVTEMGVSTATQPGFPASLSPQQQAGDISALIALADSDPLIRTVMIHTLQDAYPNLALDLVSNLGGGTIGDDVFFNEINEGFGLFTSSWRAKPAACVVSRALGGSVSC